MAVVKVKPTSPGRRAVVKVVHKHLHKGAPEASLLEPQKQNSGRNNNGHITVRHKGGGHKHHYRVVDFVRNKDGIPAKVERIEYDPNRTAHIALVCYADGERRYIIAPRGLEVGAKLLSGAEAPIKAGNTLPIRNIPVGSTIHCVEMLPGKGAQIARSAGTSVTLMARESVYAQVRLRSGEVRKIHIDCRATVWQGRRHSLEGHPPDRPRCGDEPGGSPPRRRRRPHRRGPGPGVSVEHAHQGLPHSQQQAHTEHDRVAAQEVRVHHGTLTQKRSLRGPPLAGKG
jgi:large subunit ribosomal protein L2